ncbi:MAG: hypothetical protein ACREAW_03265 [Nitrososphaera sp.]
MSGLGSETGSEFSETLPEVDSSTWLLPSLDSEDSSELELSDSDDEES